MECFAVRQIKFPEVGILNVFKDSSLVLGDLHNLSQSEAAKSDKLHCKPQGFKPYRWLEVIKRYGCTTPAHVNLSIQVGMLRLCGVEHVLSSLMMVQYNHPECHSTCSFNQPCSSSTTIFSLAAKVASRCYSSTKC